MTILVPFKEGTVPGLQPQGGSLSEQEGLYTLRKQPRENTDRMHTNDCVSRSAVRQGHHVMHLFLCQSQLGEAGEEWVYLSPPLYVHVRMPLCSLCSLSVAYVHRVLYIRSPFSPLTSTLSGPRSLSHLFLPGKVLNMGLKPCWYRRSCLLRFMMVRRRVFPSKFACVTTLK